MEAWRSELYSSELYHHGIKGQRWGVQNGPPYPIDKRVHDQMISGKRSRRAALGLLMVPGVLGLVSAGMTFVNSALLLGVGAAKASIAKVSMAAVEARIARRRKAKEVQKVVDGAMRDFGNERISNLMKTTNQAKE